MHEAVGQERRKRELLHRNPSRHLPESPTVRLGASTLAFGCSFPGCVDTVEVLLRLLLRLRTIRDLHKEHWRLLEETIDYEDVG